MSNACESCLTTSYDIMGQVISILDVTTDIIVCIGFYQKDRMVFFGISLTILCLALISYDLAFVFRFSREKNGGDFALFLCLLPISPFMPFIFYFADTTDRALSKCLTDHCCGFEITMENPYIPEGASKLRKFMEEKISKHLGFIIEALVEGIIYIHILNLILIVIYSIMYYIKYAAFPQAILQMIAIVVYNEANIVSIISILLSMLSMASKSFVFSIALASTMKQLFFNWLCAITDFFAIFVAVCWVFYEPDSDHLANAFILIKTVWFYKLYFCVLPIVGVVSIGVHVSAMYEAVKEIKRKVSNVYAIICVAFCSFFVVSFLWLCGVVAGVLVLEILHWTFLAGTLWALGTDRFTYNKTSLEFWYTLVAWINSAKQHHVGSKYKGCTSFNKKEDRMMRLCSVNHILLKHPLFPNDKVLERYLIDNKVENQYMNVTNCGLRTNSRKRKQSEFVQKFWHNLYGIVWKEFYELFENATNIEDSVRWGFLSFGTGLISFLLGPLYLLSRVATLFFPAFIILYLYFGFDVNIWNTKYVHPFQVVMISIYLVLCAALTILLYLNLMEQYLMAHILPAEEWIYCIYAHTSTKTVIEDITNHYFAIIVIPIRRAMIIDKFGPDLGQIILSYLPLDDKYENASNDVVIPKVI